MVPPLALWLAGYVTCGWWSGAETTAAHCTRGDRPGVAAVPARPSARCSTSTATHQPPWHPLPRSLGSVVSSTLIYLSLAVYPHTLRVLVARRPDRPGRILVTATLVLLARVSWHSGRPRRAAARPWD